MGSIDKEEEYAACMLATKAMPDGKHEIANGPYMTSGKPPWIRSMSPDLWRSLKSQAIRTGRRDSPWWRSTGTGGGAEAGRGEGAEAGAEEGGGSVKKAQPMLPYYQSADRAITVYHDRWENVLAAGLIVPRDVALVHADPPYGMSEPTDRRGRSKTAEKWRTNSNYPPIEGDDRPFDPAPILALSRPLVTWGANHYASRLPDSPSWWTWDKRDGTGSNCNSDGELAWTSIGASARIFHHMWNGLCRASEIGEKVLAPTQKPIALCSWVYSRAKLKRGDLVLVPYMGSGPDLAACVAMGLRCIACEVEEEYCRVAVGARLHAAPVVESPGPLFAPRLP